MKHHTGQFIPGSFTLAAALCVIADSCTGGSQTTRNIDLRFGDVHKEIANVKKAVENCVRNRPVRPSSGSDGTDYSS